MFPQPGSQHFTPCTDLHDRAAFKRSDRGIKALAFGTVKLVGLFIEHMGNDLDQRFGRFFHGFQRAIKIGGTGKNFVERRFTIGLDRVATIPLGGTCHHLRPDMGQEGFRRALGMLRSIMNAR